MRFKTDENLHPDVAVFLRNRGHDALSVWDEGLRGRPDPDLAEACRAERRAFITLDLGFADIREYPPDQFDGLVVLRLGSQSRAHLLAVLDRLMPLLQDQTLAGRLWIVEDNDVRVRGGD